MCVILHALKKRHMRRPEIVEAMRANSSGFAMFALKPDGTRESIRTLDEKELLDFFDRKVEDDDEVAMHARIPSRGGKSLANVHGWEEDGVVFMHNMTITAVDGLMREDKWEGTDSEYFFRSMFMPLYRRWGSDAYKDGKLDPYLDRMVRVFVGYSNKFLFIMPDNRVLRYGNWVSEPLRKEGDQVAFFASNSTYKVYERTWSAPPAKTAAAGRTSYLGYDDDDEADYLDYWRHREPLNSSKPARRIGYEPATYDGRTLCSLVGNDAVAAAGLKLHVLANALAYRELAILDGATDGLDVSKRIAALHAVLLQFVHNGCEDLVDAANPCNEVPAGSPPGSAEHMGAWLATWSTELESFLERDDGKVKVKYFRVAATRLCEAFDAFSARLDATLAISDVAINVHDTDVDRAIAAFAPGVSRKRRPTMWMARLTDLITPPDATDEDARASVESLLGCIAACAAHNDGIQAGPEKAGADVKGEAV